MIIRPYNDNDLDPIIALWDRCGLLRSWNDPVKDIRRKQKVQPELFLVAEERDTIIGTVMAGYDGHRGWLNYLAVDPDHQMRGVGRLLVETASSRLTEYGCPKINIQVRSANTRAVKFYRQLGFVEDEVRCFGLRLEHDDHRSNE